jgi:hypothetical protein
MISKKVIEIDDAGWGDLLGGVYITVMRMDTYEHNTFEIPLGFFRLGRGYEKKEYLSQCREGIMESLDMLDVDPIDFEIHMCQGFVFARAEERLLGRGWTVKRRRISGTVQQIVEGAYREYVLSLGFESFLPVEQRMYERKKPNGSKELISRGKFRFFQFINWLQKDPEGREQFVKTGFRNWSFWKYRIMTQRDLRDEYRKLDSK